MARQKWEYIHLYGKRQWHEPKNYAFSIAEDFEWVNNDGKTKIDDFFGYLLWLGENGWELIAVVPISSYLGGYHGPSLNIGDSTFSHDYAGFTSHIEYIFKRPKE